MVGTAAWRLNPAGKARQDRTVLVFSGTSLSCSWLVITHNLSLVLAATVVVQVQADGDDDGCHGGLLQHCLKIKKYKLYQN